MGRGAGPARSLAARVALGLCFALACSAAGDTTTGAPKDVCPEPPTRELVCYYEGSTPVSRLDACLCTSVVFTDVASKAGDGFKVDIGVRSEVRALRKRNPWVRALLQLQVGAAQLKSEERRQRASQAVSAALRKATVDGVELDLDWSHHGAANKSHLTAFVKAVRFQLDSADAVDRRRAKRDYEIFERVTKSVSTTEAATAADTDADTDATESTEPTTSETSGTAADTAADTAGTVTDDEVTMTTETSRPTATTPRSSTRTSRAEASASDLAKQYAELYGDLDDDEEEDEPSRIILLQLPTRPELIAKYYDMRALSKQVDWFILPSHNLTDESERGLTFHHSRLMGLDDLLNTDSLVDLVTGLGAPKQQIIVSLPAFALRFTLKDETKDTPRSPVVGEPERLTQQQLCALMSEGGWSVERDQDLTAPYAFKNNSWIAFEDHMSVNIKAKYVLLRDLAGLALQSVDDEDWLQTSCKPPVEDEDEDDDDDKAADKDDRSDEAKAKARLDEGQVAGADGDDGSYHPSGKQAEEKQKDAEDKKGEKKDKKAEPMPMTLLETAFKSLTESSRRTRAALLSSLENDIHQHAVEYNDYTGSVQLSPYQIVRVVDREGTVHSVRRNARTEFECSRQGYFVHPLSCNRFYRCVKYNQYSSEYTVFEFDCPAGLAFDERVEVCVWPGSLPGGACQGSSEIAPVPRSQYGCPNAEGYYADPENCRWFFACLDHARDGLSPLTAYEFRCPFGLVFDEGRQVCNWPWLVEGCGSAGASSLRYQGVRVSGAAAGSAVNYEGLSLLSGGIGGAGAGYAGAGYAGAGAGYASGASLAGNTLYTGDAGAAAGYSADASFESASFAANDASNSGYAYNQAAGGSASAGRYGENNGYIALQAAQEAGSRHEDRGYGGFATFPASQVSGGRSQGSSGVILGANLHTLQGIQGVAVGQAGSAYQASSSSAASGASAASGYDGQQTTGYSFGAGSNGAGATAGSYDYSAGSNGAGATAGSYDYSAGSNGAAASAGSYDYSAGSSTAFGAKQTTASAGLGYSAGSASTFGAKQTASTAGYYNSGASSFGATGSTASAGYDYNGVTGSSGSSYSSFGGSSGGISSTSGIQQTTPGYSFGSTSSGSDYSSGADYTASTASTLGASSGTVVQGAQSIQGVHIESDGSSGYSSAGAILTPVTEEPFVRKTAYTVTPAPYDVVSSTPAPAVVSYSQPAAVQTVTASPGVVSYQSVTPTASTVHNYKQFELQQPLVPVHAVTPATPSVVRYQSVFGLKQQQQQAVTAAPALAPEAPTLYTYKQYEVKQPVVHFQSVTPTPTVAVQSYTPTASPAYVSYTPTVQPVTAAPAYSFIRKQTPAPTPAPALAFATPSAAPAVVGYAQQQHVQHQVHAVTPGSVDHSVQYQYSSPAPFSLKNVKYHRIVDIKQEPNGYYQPEFKQYNQQQHAQVHTYQQEVKQVQAPEVQYQQHAQVHSYQQEVKQAQPVVHYQQEYKQVQPVVQYQQVKQVQPVVPVTKVEYQAPAVQYQQNAQVQSYQQEVKQVQPVVQYQQVKQIQPVVPVTKVEYQAPAVQYQHHAQVQSYQQEVKQVQPVVPVVQQYQQEVKQVQPVTRFEDQAPAVQYQQQYKQEVKQVQPVVQYQQEYKQVQPVVPVTKVEYQAPALQYQQHAQVHSYQQEVQQVQPVAPVTKVEYQAPVVQYQQYQQEVKQVQPVTKFEYKTPAFQYQNLQQYKQYKQEVQQVQPVTPAAVTKFEYHAPTQVHTYQQEVKQVQPVVPVVQYQQEVKQVQPISKFEYQAPAVQYQQYQQQVKQVQPVVQYQQEVKQVQPIATVEYQAPAVQYQQHAHAHSYQQNVKQVQPVVQYQQVKQVQPVVPVTKVEYQAPAVQYQQHAQVHSYQQVKQAQPVVQYQQEVKQVQPVIQYQQEVKQVQPVIQYQQEVKQVQPVTKFEYKAPAVQYQQHAQVHSYQQEQVQQVQPVVQYQQEVKQVQPVTKFEYKAPAIQVQQQVQYQQPAVAVKAQEVVYSYSTPSNYPIRQEAVKAVKLNVNQGFSQRPKLYPFVSSTTAAPAISQVPLLHSYTYVNGNEPSTPVPCTTCSLSTAGLRVSSTPAPARYTEQQQYVYSSTPTPARYTEQQVVYSSTPAPARYTEQQVVYSSTPAPAPAPARYTEQQYVYSSPAPARYTEQREQQVAYSVTPAPPCATCSQSSAGLKVSSTPAAFEFNYVSSTPKYEAGLVSQVSEQQTNQYRGGYQVQQQQQQQQQQLTQVDDQEPPVALFVHTAAPPPARYNQVVVSSTPAPTRYVEDQEVVVSSTPSSQQQYQQVVENYSSVRPEVYSQQYYSTPAPVSVVKNVVTQVSTPATYVEQNVEDVQNVQSVEFGAKKSHVVSEYNYVQGQEQATPTVAPAVDVYPIAPEVPATVDVQYQTSPAPVPVRRLRPSTTAAAYIEEQQQIVSEGYAGDVVVGSTAAPTAGPTRGNIRYGYEEDLQQQINAEEAIEDGEYGAKNQDAYSGLAQVIETSTLAAIGAVGSRRPGRVRVGTTAQYSEGSDEGYSSSTTESYGSSTVRAKGKGRKRTKIVVVTRLSDVNPLLIGKLGAQCSCAENGRKSRTGVKRVISRVRVVRPKDGDAGHAFSSTARSTTEGYVSSTTEGRVVSSTEQAEIDEDLALIRDAEKSDAEEGDDDAADFGAVVVSSTEGTVSSSAAYEQDDIVSSTVAIRGRGRARGRTTYIRAGKAKSTIYVSTTAEPDDDDDEQSPSSSTSSRVYEVTTPSSRRFSGRRTTARSIQINSKDDEDDAEAVVIQPRPRSRARPSPRVRSRARSDNDLASASPSPVATEVEDTNAVVDEVTPGPGHTVDLGVNGVVECKRPGLFRHPELCNKFYSCNWDKWKKKYAVNVFNCPIHLAYDTSIGACNWPSKGPACVNGKLLV